MKPSSKDSEDGAKGFFKCCSLKGVLLLTDSMPDEDFLFGGPVVSSYQTIVRTQICHASVQIFHNVVLTIPFIILLTALCALPPNGNISATGITVASAAMIQQLLNLLAVTCIPAWTDRGRQLQTIGWGLISFAPLMLANTMLKWSEQVAGKADTSQTSLWTIPPAIVCAIVTD